MIAHWMGVIIKTNADFAATNRRFAAVKRLDGFQFDVLRAGSATIETSDSNKNICEMVQTVLITGKLLDTECVIAIG